MITGVKAEIDDLKKCDFLGQKGKQSGILLKSLDAKAENNELRV